MRKFNFIIMIVGLAVLSACQNSTSQSTAEGTTAETLSEVKAETPEEKKQTYAPGDRVPHDQVCMVNDAYMGRLQMEVPFEGKMYYGCCEMCVERIPNDPSVRIAQDPHSREEVDKAAAFIVLAGPQGQVMYFANEKNYRKFLKENS